MASKRRERGLWEFFLEDPEKAEAETWGGRGPGINRRGFLKNSATALGAVLGTGIPFIDSSPTGWIPAALAETNEPFEIPGKNGLVLLNDRPINAETPPHLLDDAVTPFDRHFVRNNGLPPVLDKSDIEQWVLTVDGEVHKPLSLSLEQLKKFKTITQQVVVECGGNGRAGFYPPAKGNQWTFGAVACPSYTGARLMDVLKEAGVKPSAVYTGYYGKDTHLSGDPSRIPISRGTPIAKAMDPRLGRRSPLSLRPNAGTNSAAPARVVAAAASQKPRVFKYPRNGFQFRATCSTAPSTNTMLSHSWMPFTRRSPRWKNIMIPVMAVTKNRAMGNGVPRVFSIFLNIVDHQGGAPPDAAQASGGAR